VILFNATWPAHGDHWPVSRRRARPAHRHPGRDLQNPPEEIGRLIAKMNEGYDYVGSIRRMRQTALSPLRLQAIEPVRERITRIRMSDQGCMLRAYSREIIDAINSCREVTPTIRRSLTPLPSARWKSRSSTRSAQPASPSIRCIVIAQLRPGDRVFAGAAADVLALPGMLISLLSILFVGYWRCAGCCWARRPKRVSPCSASSSFLLGIGLFASLLGELRGPHFAAGAPASSAI